MRLSGLVRSIVVVAGAIAALVATRPAYAQGSAVIRGTVVDSTNQRPVAAAQIVIVGSTVGGMSSADGDFIITRVPPGAVTLRVQRIGYKPVTRALDLDANDTATVRIAMEPSAVQLSAVVSVGYGESSREDVSSAIASVSAEEIANTPIAGIDAALQGKAAGVQVIQNAGNPGAGITVRIRGAASISASNQPLFVVDGVPMLRDNFSQMDMGGQDVTAVTGLNPDEIESIDILKDAAAAAIYGSRASNGVVLVTTKRGKANQNKVTFSGYTGTASVPTESRWEMLTGREYMEFMNEGVRQDSILYEDIGFPTGYAAEDYTPLFSDADIASAINNDWQDAVFRNAPVNDLTLGASGGTDRVRYFLSGSMFDQEGVVIGSSYERLGGRVNLDFDASSKLSFRTSLAISRETHERIENDDTIDGVVTNAIANEPFYPVYDDEGVFTDPTNGAQYTNPVALGTFNSAESRSQRAIGSVEARYMLGGGLALNGRFGMDVLNLRDLRWDSPKVIGTYASEVGGVGTYATAAADRYVIESYLTYDRPMWMATAFSLTAGASAEWNEEEYDYLRGEGFSTEGFQYVGNASRITDYDGRWTGHNLVSGFARANMTLLDRYLVTANVRVDGSSRFGENNRYGVFPAVSLGWKVTDEAFAAGLADVAELKLRGSFGLTGNQDIGEDFAPLARFNRASYADIPGLAQESFGNPDLRWETTEEYDVGFDLGLLDGRLVVLGDWYLKTTRDLLLNRPITSTSGQTSVFENVGNMKNSGYELGVSTINLEPSETDGFRWATDFNISWNKNEVTRLFRDEPFSVGYYSVGRVDVGHPLAAFYTLRYLGVDPATGDAIYDDVAGGPNGEPDGEITSADRVYIGSPHPDFWGGLTNTMSWRGFDLRSFFQFVQGQQIFNAISVFANDGGYNYDNKFKQVLDRWQQPGDIARHPRTSFDATSGAEIVSSRFFEDGSYVRLQEVTLGYRLPMQLLGNAGLSEGRIYVSGRNLYTWTDYSGYSPDVNSPGSSSNTSLATEFYAYPLSRTFMIGISGAW